MLFFMRVHCSGDKQLLLTGMFAGGDGVLCVLSREGLAVVVTTV